ncbi:MAG TPA: choice-of-anchor L domain-containing protein, partial [Flavobacteriaceae bacterium]|nr:choice-of-anchor L domain-containing protein [Flavobacteriaceae bacterium]
MKNFLLPLLFLFPVLSFAQDIEMQNGTFNQCGGNLYDSGGNDGNYADSEDFTLTICPDVAGNFVQLDFTAFATDSGNDVLKIYNADTADPAFLIGEFSGNDVPGIIKATTENPAATGCLTLVFESDDTGNATGWEAAISCVDNSVIMGQTSNNGTFTQCSGMFYDNGGAGGTYTEAGGTQVVTICSDDPNLITQVEFTSFLLAAGPPGGPDYLNIYDGNSTAAPLMGSYTGGSLNGDVIFASGANTSGCLTFEFVPNESFSPLAGWAAIISCREPCQLIQPSIVSVTPSEPFGANGYEVAILEEITFVATSVFGDTADGATFEWDFGDGGSAVGETVTHTFDSVNLETVTLTVTDAVGCIAEIEFPVNVVFNAIITDNTTYTVPELVENVLINSDCAQISGITWSTGTNFGEENGIAYFNGNNSSFPIAAGIVMSTGNAMEAPGPETGTQSSGGWPGDSDLLAIAQTIPNVNTSDTNDATIIEFDFLSFANELSFNFLFAAEEYGTYQCGYSDVFAFLLTDSNGNTTNIAVVPGTSPPVPIAVTTVKNDLYNGGCPSANEQYFDTYYGSGGANVAYAPIDFKGHTVLMTASAPIIPGETYHIKLAIADANDNLFNSAVFLEAGSFDVGTPDLGMDLTQANGNSPCEEDEVLLDIGLEIITGATVEWFKNDVVIPGENDPTLLVSEAATYKGVYTYLTDCVLQDEVIIEYRPKPEAFAPENDVVCGDTSATFFDLTETYPEILGPDQNLLVNSVKFYETAEAAEDGIPGTEILDPENYLIETLPIQTIYVRVEDNFYGCYETTMFNIGAFEQPIANDPEPLFICDSNGDPDIIPPIDLTQNNDDVLGAQDGTLYTISYYTTQAGADSGDDALAIDPADAYVPGNTSETIYVRIENNASTDCYATTSFELTVNEINIGEPEDLNICEPDGDGLGIFDLTQNNTEVLDGQSSTDYTVTYHETQADADAGTPEIATPAAYPNTANNQTVYVRIENNTDPTCYLTGSFVLTAYQQATAQ